MNLRLLRILCLLLFVLLAGCASGPLPGPPYFGGPSPVPSTIPGQPTSGAVSFGPMTPTVGDYNTLVTRLRTAGAQVEEAGPTSASIFQGTGRILRVNGGEVQVFEYADETAAQTEAGRLSADGNTFNEAKVDWAGPPHFYQRGRILVVYVGNDTAVINPVEFALGRQIAGITVSGTRVAINPLRTPTVTPTPIPTARPVANSPANCRNAASLVADVTIPDNSAMPPSQRFVKTWRLKNTGTCTWTPDYGMVFASGTAMGAPDVVPFPTEVAPGGTMDISVLLTAPSNPGSYRGNYRLRDVTKQSFGIGSSRNSPFWVQIAVRRGSPTLAQPGSSAATPQATPQPTARSTAGPGKTTTPAQAAPASRQRINIPAGATAVSISFRLAPNRSQEYVLRGNGGQRMRIWLDRPGTSVSLSGPNGSLDPVRASADKMFVEYVLSTTADYVISLQGASNTMIIEIPPI